MHVFIFDIRCERYDPSEYWKDHNGRPFGFSLTHQKCRNPWYYGEVERYCKVDCDVDGFCTETVKQRKCICAKNEEKEGAKENCTTLQYQVMH